jgi:hypothetical protein
MIFEGPSPTKRSISFCTYFQSMTSQGWLNKGHRIRNSLQYNTINNKTYAHQDLTRDTYRHILHMAWNLSLLGLWHLFHHSGIYAVSFFPADNHSMRIKGVRSCPLTVPSKSHTMQPYTANAVTCEKRMLFTFKNKITTLPHSVVKCESLTIMMEQ